MTPTYGTPGASCAILKEQDDLNRDIQQMLNEMGAPVTVNIRGEAGIRRDLYGSIKAWTSTTVIPPFTIGAYPFEYSPSQRQLEKAGMKEHCDLLIHTAMMEWTDRGIDVLAIDLERTTIIAGGVTWKIRERSIQTMFGNAGGYLALGLERM